MGLSLPTPPSLGTECEPWPHGHDGHGYPAIYVDGKTVKAHRYLWEQAHGPIPEGLVIRHRCGNEWCVALDHLTPGTTAENNQDTIDQGRHWTQNRDAFACGHRISDDNTVWQNRAKGWRACRTCYNARKKIMNRNRRKRRKASS